MAYADGTSVPAERSRFEIEATLKRYGAGEFAYATNPRAVMICFRMKNRLVRFHLPTPAVEDFAVSEGGRMRSESARDAAYAGAIRQRWRALALVIKAKLEAVKSSITDFEEEFLAHIVLPGGLTVGEATRAGIEEAYKSGKAPMSLLPFDGPGKTK